MATGCGEIWHDPNPRGISVGPLIAAGCTKLALVTAIGSLILNFGLTIWAINIFGYLGAAAATLVMNYVWTGSFDALLISRAYHTP